MEGTKFKTLNIIVSSQENRRAGLRFSLNGIFSKFSLIAKQVMFLFRYDRRCGIKYDIVYDSVNEKACTRTYEEKCDGKNHVE